MATTTNNNNNTSQEKEEKEGSCCFGGLFEYDGDLMATLGPPPTTKDSSNSNNQQQPKLVSFKEIAKLFSDDNENNLKPLIDMQKQAFLMFSQKKVSILPIQTIGQTPAASLTAGPDAQCCIKTGYIENDDYFVTKAAAGGGKFAGNTGTVLLFEQKTMRLKYILQDEGILTEMRTAAACGITINGC